VDKLPEDPEARRAFLERWVKSLLAAEERSRAVEAHKRRVEEQWRLDAEESARVVAQARQRIAQADSLSGVAVIPVVITRPSDVPVDRAAVFADLMACLREYTWADPIVSECNEPRYIAPKAIDLARRHRPDAPWILYMEDDVILGPDFGLLPGLLGEADELFPDAGIVSFFSESFSELGWSRRSMGEFGWLQCAAIRNTDHLVGFRAFIDDVVTQSAGKKGSRVLPYEIPDLSVQMFLAAEYDAYALWYPNLVEHARVVPSVFRHWQAGLWRRT
jgi:hypothetical protein